MPLQLLCSSFTMLIARSLSTLNSFLIILVKKKEKNIAYSIEIPCLHEEKWYALKSHFLKDKRNLLRIFYILRAQNEAAA